MAKMREFPMFGNKDSRPIQAVISDTRKKQLFDRAEEKYGKNFDIKILGIDPELSALLVTYSQAIIINDIDQQNTMQGFSDKRDGAKDIIAETRETPGSATDKSDGGKNNQ